LTTFLLILLYTIPFKFKCLCICKTSFSPKVNCQNFKPKLYYLFGIYCI